MENLKKRKHIIGGHDTGKSTLIESLRYVCDKEPAECVKKTHQSLCGYNLRGFRVSITLCSSVQRKSTCTISRYSGGPAEVRNQHGEASQLGVKDIMPAVGKYSQNETFEIAKNDKAQIKLFFRLFPSQNAHKEHNQEYWDISYSQSGKLKGPIDELNKGNLQGCLRTEFKPAEDRSRLRKFLAGLPGMLTWFCTIMLQIAIILKLYGFL